MENEDCDGGGLFQYCNWGLMNNAFGCFNPRSDTNAKITEFPFFHYTCCTYSVLEDISSSRAQFLGHVPGQKLTSGLCFLIGLASG